MLRKFQLLPLLTIAVVFYAQKVKGQSCDYTISPSTHHNWVNVTAQRITDSIGAGADSMILRNSKKIIAASEPYNAKQSLITRSFIKWDMSFNKSNICNFNSTKLNLSFTGNSLDSHKIDSGANDFLISRIVEPWGPDTLRWKTPPLTAPYRMPLTTSKDAILVKGSTKGDEDFSVDIRKLMNFWRLYPDSNFGFEIRLVYESGVRSVNLANSKFPAVIARPEIKTSLPDCSLNKANAGKDISICIGSSSELVGKGSEFFEWKSTAPIDNKYIANPTTKPTAKGTYQYVLKTTLGTCESTDTMELTVHPYPVITVSSDKEICYGDSVTITVSGATNYTWTPKSDISDVNSASPNVYPKKTTRYDVTADDGNKCTTIDSVKVVVRPLTKTVASEDVSICEGDKIDLLVTGGVTYKWTGNTTGLSATNIPNPKASPKSSITYYVTASNGYCPVGDSVRITVIPKFSVDAGADFEICLGDTAYLDGETGFFFYRWSPGFIMSKTNIPDPYILNLGQTTTVKLYVEDENKCSAEDSVKITVHEPPSLYIGSDTFVCITETVDITIDQLKGNQPYKFEWSPTFGITTDPSAKDITIEGVKDTLILYELTVEDKNGCISKDDILVTTLPGIEIITFGDTTICNGAAVELRAKGGRFYEWFGEDILGSDIKKTVLVKPDKPTTYRVEVSNGEACGNAVGFVDVNVIQLPEVYAHLASSQTENDTVFVCKGREVVLEAKGAEMYIWNTEDTSVTVTYRLLVDSVYLSVFGISKGCVGKTDSILLRIDQTDTCFSNLFIPSAFTPNDDLKNDQFAIQPFLISDFKMSIFNRWGQILFETDDPYNWWDGYYNDKRVPEGAYYYVIEAFGKDEESRSTSGTVQVIY